MPSIVNRRVMAFALVAVGLIASYTSASALIHTCSNTEIRTIVTDAFIISCTGVGGTVKCTSSGKQTCCKKVDGYDICSPKPSDLSSIRPPRADPGPGRVGPTQNPSLPPRASSPPSRMGSPASTGPRVK